MTKIKSGRTEWTHVSHGRWMHVAFLRSLAVLWAVWEKISLVGIGNESVLPEFRSLYLQLVQVVYLIGRIGWLHHCSSFHYSDDDGQQYLPYDGDVLN